ncbi:hypothetical protein C8J56DRAFT_1071519 [Mycena floridula]|nr:hypothetical protein C8J56DRAFT_1071519 [Mycena floridula]
MHVKDEQQSTPSFLSQFKQLHAPCNTQEPSAGNISQAAKKFLKMQDVYEEAVGQITKIQDKAFGASLTFWCNLYILMMPPVNEFNQMLGQSPSRNRLAVVDVLQLACLHQMPASQESDVWDGMSSPLLGYQTLQPSPSRAHSTAPHANA